MSGRRRGAAIFVALLFSVAILGVAAPTAVAKNPHDCDEAYGCPPTTKKPKHDASCSMSNSSAVSPGETVVATLTNVPVGTPASLTLDGAVVASGTAEQGVGGSSDGDGGVVLSFTVPRDLSPGTHQLVFSGGGVLCDPTGGSGLRVVAVLGTQAVRGLETPRSTSGGILARTGVRIALFLAIALVLVLVGASLVRAARRRRRRRARALNDVEDLVSR